MINARSFVPSIEWGSGTRRNNEMLRKLNPACPVLLFLVQHPEFGCEAVTLLYTFHRFLACNYTPANVNVHVHVHPNPNPNLNASVYHHSNPHPHPHPHHLNTPTHHPLLIRYSLHLPFVHGIGHGTWDMGHGT